MPNTLILVDKMDNEIGYDEKEKCHKGDLKLHRSFSVFIFNSDGKLLIQKRSRSKNTWPGFWSNTCCSHPYKGESAEAAARRRLKEELGFSCPLNFLFKFEYEAKYNSVWGEHEMDWVFSGYYDGNIKPNKDEIEEIKFVDVNWLKKDIKANPGKYTPWLKICFENVLDRI
mgnify:CR=1 FL=1